jgi:hypothetical protein
MRLLILISFIPLLLASQTDSTTNTKNDLWHRYRPRIGVVRSTDSATKTPYTVRGNFFSEENVPSYREIKGGARVSPGWKVGAGIRVLVHKHLCLSIGGYYLDQRVLVNWPTFVGRNPQGSILHFQNTGLQIGALLGW